MNSKTEGMKGDIRGDSPEAPSVTGFDEDRSDRRKYSSRSCPPFRKYRKALVVLTAMVTLLFLTSTLVPSLARSDVPAPASASSPSSFTDPALIGTGDDLTLGSRSSNLTVESLSYKYKVWTQEYMIYVDYSSAYVEYRIYPYYSTDYIRYKRANPQYAGDGTVDLNGNALDSVFMTISSWGRDGNTVWFMESCPEFSLKQSFNIYRDYFELNTTYKPGTNKVLTTYYIGLCSKSNGLYDLMADGHVNRYVPGYAEDRSEGAGLGGWYPSLWMFAPACDMRVPGGSMGVEWGYEDTVAYLFSPLWLGSGSGGASVFALKYASMNSVVPNLALDEEETFHMYVRPYKYTDGKDHGYDVGYAQWVSGKIAAKWGNHNRQIFPLTMMNLADWSSSFQTWVESSQIKLATYSTNPNQFDWNYKAAQTPNMDPGTPSTVPTAWQIMKKGMVPMTWANGVVMCNPVDGPYTRSGSYRWQLINNDDYMDWWTGSGAVFWDAINLWDAYNYLKSDYQQRSEFLYDGYLHLMQDTYASGYWDFAVGNSFTGLLHLAIVTDLTVIEGYQPSSVYGTDMSKHVQSTMNFVNNIPAAYRPQILVYQTYATGSSNDQLDVYSVLFDSAKYGFAVDLTCYDSWDAQLHNLQMAETMFKAMGCTRDSNVRIPVATLDLSVASTVSTSASMVVLKSSGTPTITSTASSSPATFKITNLHSGSRQFNLAFSSANYYLAGSNVQTASRMTFTPDGKGTYHGTIAAEKTGEVTRQSNLQIAHRDAGKVDVSLISLKSDSAKLELYATGGVTDVTLKGMRANTLFSILVNSIPVMEVTSGGDGTLSFSRAFGSADVVQVLVSDSTPDTVPPTVTGNVPASGAAGVPINTTIKVLFSEAMDLDSMESSFQLSSGTSVVDGQGSWNVTERSWTFVPSSALSFSTTYLVTVNETAMDLAGNTLSSTFQFSFQTEAPPPPPPTPPSYPRNLAATPGLKQITLSWVAPSSDGGSPLTGYKVYRATSSDGQYSLLASIGVQNSYSNVALQDGATYYYKVSAINLIGEGTMSSYSSATTFNVPSAPLSLKAVGKDSSITLTWSAPTSNGGTSIINYQIWRGTSSSSKTLLATTGPTTSYVDSGLVNGDKYYYAVAAVNAVGAGSMSTESSATVGTTPTAPLDLTAVVGDGWVRLSWGTPSEDGGFDITGYDVYRALGSGAAALIAPIGLLNEFNDTSLINGQTYRYHVVAVNELGEGGSSSIVTVTPFTYPYAPEGLVATGSLGQVALQWQPPSWDGGSPILGYDIYRRSPLGQAQLLVGVNATTLSYVDLGLENGAEYLYTIRAFNARGEGDPSVEAIGITNSTPPDAPQGLTIKAGRSEILITWQPPGSLGTGDLIGYRVYRGTDPESMALVIELGVETRFLDHDIEVGSTYYYCVSALTAFGEGPVSSTVLGVIWAEPPPPQQFSARTMGSIITLTWASPALKEGEPLQGYHVYMAEDEGEWRLLATVGPTKTFFTQGALELEVIYSFKVTAFNDFGESDPTPIIQIFIIPMPLPPPPLPPELMVTPVPLRVP